MTSTTTAPARTIERLVISASVTAAVCQSLVLAGIPFSTEPYPDGTFMLQFKPEHEKRVDGLLADHIDSETKEAIRRVLRRADEIDATITNPNRSIAGGNDRTPDGDDYNDLQAALEPLRVLAKRMKVLP